MQVRARNGNAFLDDLQEKKNKDENNDIKLMETCGKEKYLTFSEYQTFARKTSHLLWHPSADDDWPQ